MSETTFRIGICGCTNHYNGAFKKSRIRVWKRLVRLEEVVISKEHTDGEIWRKRCHFFLDAHRNNGRLPQGWKRYHVVLDIRSPGISRWNGRKRLFPWAIREKISNHPASARTIKKWIKDFTEWIDIEHREAWTKMEVVR